MGLTPFVTGYLVQDGLANGAIYCLLALAILFVFTVTRIILIPQGEFVSYAALTYALLRDGRVPGTLLFVVVLAGLAATLDLAQGAWRRRLGRAAIETARAAAAPLGIAALTYAATRVSLPAIVHASLTVALVASMGPLLYRVVYRPLAGASTLVLLIVSVALHLVLVEFGLYFFGPGGGRTAPLIDISTSIGGVPIQAQSIVIYGVTVLLIAGLFGLAEKTLVGKALRAAAINPAGARLMGISREMAGRVALTVAAFIGAVAGVLVSSVTTIYYDTGFILGLKGFVAAVVGGLGVYPVAVAGAFGVGVLESFAAFFASQYKETIVFALIIPALLWRSLAARGAVEED